MQYLNNEYWNKHIYSTQKGFEECVREETAHLATLKSKKVLDDSLPKDIAEIETGIAENSSPRTKQTDGKNLVWWRNRKKISQIIKDYFYLPFFLLIILWRER